MAAGFDGGFGGFGLSTGLPMRLAAGTGGQRAWRHSGDDRGGAIVRADLPTRDSIRMTRFLIFAAMAPPLGFVVAFWVMLQIANWLAGSPPNTFDVTQMMMLPTIYLIGLIPALAAAWFDHVLAKRHVSHRIARTALFGYAISFLPMIASFRFGVVLGPEVLLLGLVGAVPSAVCSWLAAEGQLTEFVPSP
jgi:hypothetical protein